MVAQPTGSGLSVFALFALSNAVFSAARDIASRLVPPEIPGLVVAFGATLVVLAGAGPLHLAVEDWVTPTPTNLLLLGAAGLFLLGGHYFIFMAYRIGPASTVAPFYYLFTIWAVVSGLLVFRELPNLLALAGIALVIAAGVGVVLLDQRNRRLLPEA
jgi:drug/metabolite transporter (DMT)-like permease